MVQNGDSPSPRISEEDLAYYRGHAAHIMGYHKEDLTVVELSVVFILLFCVFLTGFSVMGFFGGP